jgi:hypothetical protein
MHEVTLKSAQLESKRKKVCIMCAQKWISHHFKCATLVQNIKKKSAQSLQLVCKTSKKVCNLSANCTLCRLVHTFEKVCTNLPPDVAYLCILLYTVIYTDIYYFKKVYTRIYSYVLCISVYILLYTVIYGHILLQQSIYSYILVCALHICVYTLIYCDILTYTTSTEYILVYTLMYSVFLCIYY